MNTKDKECKGSLKVSEDVISKIAATAASETEGAFCGEDNVFVRYSGGAAEINIELSLKEGVRGCMLCGISSGGRKERRAEYDGNYCFKSER